MPLHKEDLSYLKDLQQTLARQCYEGFLAANINELLLLKQTDYWTPANGSMKFEP